MIDKNDFEVFSKDMPLDGKHRALGDRRWYNHELYQKAMYKSKGLVKIEGISNVSVSLDVGTDLFSECAIEIESEWKRGGLSGGLSGGFYEKYARAVHNRFIDKLSSH